MRLLFIPLLFIILFGMSSPLHAATQSAYALHHSEMARLRQKAADLFTLLQEGKYSELQTQMAIESAKPRIKYNDESRLEYYMRCWSSYQYITPQIFKKIEAWSAKYPDSDIPYTAEAILIYKKLPLFEGGFWPGSLPQDVEEMVHLGLKMVLERTEKAVEINAKNAAAWHYLILSTVPYNTESESISLRYFRQAVREIPDYYWIYEAYQRSLFWHASAKRISHFYQTYVSIRAEQYPHLNFLYAENHIMSAFAAEMTKDAIDHIYKDAPVSRFLEHLVWGTSSSRKYLKNRSVWEEIENSFHKAHAYKPENLYFMKRYSAAALNAQKTKIAQIYLDRMIAIDPTYDIYTIIRAGYLEQKKKNFNEAIAYYQMAVKLFPEHRHALGALGFVYTQNNQWPESAQIYQKLTKIYPKRMYWANLCASLARVKQYDNAHKACDKAIEIDPAEPWSYHLKGWVYKWQGQNEKGEEYIKHAKAIGWKGYPKY